MQPSQTVIPQTLFVALHCVLVPVDHSQPLRLIIELDLPSAESSHVRQLTPAPIGITCAWLVTPHSVIGVNNHKRAPCGANVDTFATCPSYFLGCLMNGCLHVLVTKHGSICVSANAKAVMVCLQRGQVVFYAPSMFLLFVDARLLALTVHTHTGRPSLLGSCT